MSKRYFRIGFYPVSCWVWDESKQKAVWLHRDGTQEPSSLDLRDIDDTDKDVTSQVAAVLSHQPAAQSKEEAQEEGYKIGYEQAKKDCGYVWDKGYAQGRAEALREIGRACRHALASEGGFQIETANHSPCEHDSAHRVAVS